MRPDALSDLSRLRVIAEEGRRLPLLGGRLMILWGVLIAGATLLHGAVLARLLPLGQEALGPLWLLTIVSGAAMGSLVRRRRSGPPPTDIANRIEASAWFTGGAFLTLLSLGIFAQAVTRLLRTGSPAGFDLFAAMPPATFGVYAIALSVSATAANVPGLKPFAWASVGMACLTAMLSASPWQYLLSGLGVLLVSVPAGLLLVRLEPDAARG